MTLLGEPLELSHHPEQFKDTITGKLYCSSSMTAITQYFDQRHLPITASNIPAELFAEALLEVLQGLPNANSPASRETASEITIENLLLIIESSPEISSQLRANLKQLIRRTRIVEPDSKQQMTQLKHEIALWFNQGMQGAFTVYKHNLKTFSFLVSYVLAVVINADSLYAIRRISENTATRAIITQNATQIQGCRDNLNSPRCVEQMSLLMESTTLPIGWQTANRHRQFAHQSWGTLFRTAGGWSLTAIAISMGSRFWLRLLNRLVHFRGGDSNPEPFTRYRNYRSPYSDLR